MNEKRFKLSKYVTPSSVSNFCDENGRMLNKEVVKVLNEQQATIQSLQTELELVSGAKLFSRRELERKVKEQQATIEQLQKENIELKKLRKYCAEWIGVKEENLYDVVR